MHFWRRATAVAIIYLYQCISEALGGSSFFEELDEALKDSQHGEMNEFVRALFDNIDNLGLVDRSDEMPIGSRSDDAGRRTLWHWLARHGPAAPFFLGAVLVSDLGRVWL